MLRRFVRKAASARRSQPLSLIAKIVGEVRSYLSCLVVLTLIGGWLLSFAPAIFAQSPNQIALVVIHGDGSATTRCVEFSEPEVTGYDLLQRSQLTLSVDAGSMGAAVCAIDGEGCTVPQDNCFCGMNRNPPVYWSYWQVVNGQWQYSQLGAGSSVVKPGEVEGWIWGTGNKSAPPPSYSFAQICAPSTATPTLTLTPLPTATAGAQATPTPTFTLTFTPGPTVTATPTWTPSPTLSPTTTWTPRPTVTSTFLPTNVAVAAQATVAQSHLLRLPAVQAAAAATIGAEEASALPTFTSAPSATPMPTPIPSATAIPTRPTATNSPQAVALVATEPSTPTPEAASIPVTPLQQVGTGIVTASKVISIVVTAPAGASAAPVATSEAGAPVLLPAITPSAPLFASQMSALASIILGVGALIALPVGLVIVAALAYWIGSKL